MHDIRPQEMREHRERLVARQGTVANPRSLATGYEEAARRLLHDIKRHLHAAPTVAHLHGGRGRERGPHDGLEVSPDLAARLGPAAVVVPYPVASSGWIAGSSSKKMRAVEEAR